MSGTDAALRPWHDAFVLPYAAYLRVYEPLAAFPEAEGQRWAAYAASADRPRRAAALAAEQADALRRLASWPPVAVPAQDSADAYVRWVEGITYICPWQTRLRSWLALARLGESAPALVSAAFGCGQMDVVAGGFCREHLEDPSPRVHIQAATWSVPPEWFVPFTAGERWLALGRGGDSGEGGRATAATTRALVYATTIAAARRRVARALAAAGRAGSDAAADAAAGGGGRAAGGWEHWEQMWAGIEPIGRWLEEFHPRSLVELDYGGLVHLLSDGAMRADQSVMEVGTAVRALGLGEFELATAMHRRVRRRWQALEALSVAS